jgi:hypothetical protein
VHGIGLPLLRIKNGAVGSTLLILGLAWISGCSGNSVKSAWHDPAAGHSSYSKILIVGVSTDFTQRCAFEYSMASQFQGSSTTPFASCDSMTPKDRLTRANIERVATSDHVDAVLTSAVVTLTLGAQQGNTRDTRATPYYQVTGVGWVTGDLGEYGIPVAFVQLESTPSIPQITGEVHVLTKLFGAKDATLLYSLDTKAKTDDMQSTSSSIDTITALIADRLRRDGVIH